jgi:hypothetical protein
MATDRGVRLAVAVQLCDYNETWSVVMTAQD